MRTENLIVGLGIAGINLCHQLQRQGRPFVVIDPCPAQTSSIIAGGIYNPVGIKRKVKSWKVDALFPILVDTYRELETLLNVSFLHHDFPILKPVSSEQELTEWQTAIDEGRLSPYAEKLVMGRPAGPFNVNVLGSVTIRNGGFVETDVLIKAYREYLRHIGSLLENRFDHFVLEDRGNTMVYGDVVADRVIFCEGRHISENPFFSWLPMRPTKGQMLSVKVAPQLAPDHIYNQQFFMFPCREKNIFRLGATYEWHDLNEDPTVAAREELVSRVGKALDVNMEVIGQQAAIRPNVADRRPLVGRHPENPNIVLFNGMGSKGVMLAPYFARQLVNHIYAGGEIEPEADLRRFIHRYERDEVKA
ncbi:MAG: FAD-binding oxidoreductase [Flavobacteriales bacterium]|nr:FAD-binding oxidoreductase [Flavobacteriales bacterium]